jgi:hypothetical protein
MTFYPEPPHNGLQGFLANKSLPLLRWLATETNSSLNKRAACMSWDLLGIMNVEKLDIEHLEYRE